MSARGRDRRVYLRSHPVLFALLAATRHRRALRIGSTVLVHDREAYRTALTRVPLDRTAEGTTGGAAGELAGRGALFDQHGEDHRDTRRDTADLLGAAGVARLRPVWTALLDARLPALAAGGRLDVVPLAAEIAGTTAAALLDLGVDPLDLASAAQEAAAAAARAHLPGPGRRRATRSAEAHAARLLDLVAPARRDEAGLAAMLAVAAVNTTVAAIPRAVAWACDAGLWEHASSPALADELLRVTAPTPLLPRVAAADAEVGGCPVRAGDRMLLIARHAAGAHRDDPCPSNPAPPPTSQLVFGAGPHACPGARLARTQLADVLAALAPYRPAVTRARADRRAALPSWRSLAVRATTQPTPRVGGPHHPTAGPGLGVGQAGRPSSSTGAPASTTRTAPLPAPRRPAEGRERRAGER
ncbi:cytochrome P450 [Paractinoplanes deccanensis]|uniref:Cytochrome P450 n=1 Tax=Paractinoplanes deccanensis TaxID=113561 RepID=A0ABQ3Y794_9ACTN|nr:cytochrome P450 [Actinoplanes deccanensis]GID75864.1 cytochrome P450 [Actinoplanes deccanensis]